MAEKEVKNINIYEINSPLLLAENKLLIQKFFVKGLNLNLPDFIVPRFTFNIDSVSGAIEFILNNDLWLNKPKQNLPRDYKEAKACADRFIQSLLLQLNSDDFRKTKIPPLLPINTNAKIVHNATAPVFHFQEPWIDHWLCRYEIFLKTFSNDSSYGRVMGSEIDIRIGQNGSVISFSSFWRPSFLKRSEAEYFDSHDLIDEEDLPHEHEHPELVYVLDGQNCPQTFITPYHSLPDGHHGTVIPASSYSLLVRLGFAEKLEGGAFVIPIILGGSGNYITNWSYWKPDTIFDEGMITLGEQEFIELDPGVYNILLHVKDSDTGVVQLFESSASVKYGVEIESTEELQA